MILGEAERHRRPVFVAYTINVVEGRSNRTHAAGFHSVNHPITAVGKRRANKPFQPFRDHTVIAAGHARALEGVRHATTCTGLEAFHYRAAASGLISLIFIPFPQWF